MAKESIGTSVRIKNGIIAIAILFILGCGTGARTTDLPTPTSTDIPTPTPNATAEWFSWLNEQSDQIEELARDIDVLYFDICPRGWYDLTEVDPRWLHEQAVKALATFNYKYRDVGELTSNAVMGLIADLAHVRGRLEDLCLNK